MKAKLCKGVRIRKEEFGGIVLSRREGVQQVDKIGFEILSQIKDDIEIEKIIEDMKKKYQADPERIENDVNGFIKKLVEGGVIEIEKN